MANNKPFKIKNGLSAKVYLQSSSALGASDVDVSAGSYFSKTLTADTALTFSNPPASGLASSFALEITGANMTVGYDIANAAYDSVSFYTGYYFTALRGLTFKPDGTRMYATGSPRLDPSSEHRCLHFQHRDCAEFARSVRPTKRLRSRQGKH